MRASTLTADEWRMYQAMCSVQALVYAVENYTPAMLLTDVKYIHEQLTEALALVGAVKGEHDEQQESAGVG